MWPESSRVLVEINSKSVGQARRLVQALPGGHNEQFLVLFGYHDWDFLWFYSVVRQTSGCIQKIGHVFIPCHGSIPTANVTLTPVVKALSRSCWAPLNSNTRRISNTKDSFPPPPVAQKDIFCGMTTPWLFNQDKKSVNVSASSLYQKRMPRNASRVWEWP